MDGPTPERLGCLHSNGCYGVVYISTVAREDPEVVNGNQKGVVDLKWWGLWGAHPCKDGEVA